jgi:glycosyltransferase involved in cell wall biosynthesis
MSQPRFSIIVIAHNEETYLPKCLAAIAKASAHYPEGAVQTIVSLNNCTDGTERVAREWAADVTYCPEPNLSVIRNAGARLAVGQIIISMDADHQIAPNTLQEIEKALATGKYIGGGVRVVADRSSVPIILTGLVVQGIFLSMGISSAGVFWCYRSDFEAIGGFDPAHLNAEDIDFGRRLKALGATQGKRFHTLWNAPMLTSTRKFDRLGDWYVFRMFLEDPRGFVRVLKGRDDRIADEYWYRGSREARQAQANGGTAA